MKSLQAGCDVSELRSTGDKLCKRVSNILDSPLHFNQNLWIISGSYFSTRSGVTMAWSSS